MTTPGEDDEGSVTGDAVDDVTYVFVAGVGNSGAGHWQRSWLDRVAKGVWVEHDEWDVPERDVWVSDLQKAVWKIRGPMVFVAHSLGCLVVAEWASEREDPAVKGAFLVAPPDPQGPAFPRRTASTFMGVSARPLPCPALVVGSADDPYCAPEVAEGFAERWDARWHLVGAYGHINSASGLGSWREGRELLDSLTPREPSR